MVFEDTPQPQPGMGEILLRVHPTRAMWQVPTWSKTWKHEKRRRRIGGIEAMIPVTGATSAVGKAVIEELLARKISIRAFVHKPVDVAKLQVQKRKIF